MEMSIPSPLEVAADGDGHVDHDHDQNIIRRRSLNYNIHNNSSIKIELEGRKVRSDENDEDEEDLRSETSSIGVCSSISEASVSSAADENDIEVQSKRTDDPNCNSLHQHEHELHLHLELDSNPNTNESSLTSLDSLEDSLPFKRGLSNFYCGKSKSFTSLSNVANATAKDLIKPENPLNKRRRLLIAWSHNRRASCSNLVSIAESPLLPLPPVVSECDEEDEEDHEDEDEVEDALVTTVMRRTRSDKEKKRPSLFTVAVSRQQVFNEYDNDPHLPPFLTPKPSISSTKMQLRLPGRSFSLSDLSQHTHAHAPP